MQVLASSYPEIERYQKDHLILAVAKKDKRLLAIYEEKRGLSPKDLRKLINSLMLTYGEPTLEAHGQILYWIYDVQGKVEREAYERWRQESQNLKIEGMVKLVVRKNISQFGEGKLKGKTDCYISVSAPELIKKYVSTEELLKGR